MTETQKKVMLTKYFSSAWTWYKQFWKKKCRTDSVPNTKALKANHLAYIGGQNQLFSLNCVMITFSCEKRIIFHTSRKLAFKSNGFLKLAQWVVSLNIKLDIEKPKAKP